MLDYRPVDVVIHIFDGRALGNLNLAGLESIIAVSGRPDKRKRYCLYYLEICRRNSNWISDIAHALSAVSPCQVPGVFPAGLSNATLASAWP